MKKLFKNAFIFLFTVSLITVFGCNPNDQTENLQITSISPDSVLSNMPVTITVTGEGFNRDSAIVVGGAQVETIFDSGEQLRGNIAATQTALALDSESGNIYVQVEQPKDSSPYEINRSNVLSLEIRHIPQCGDPVLIHSGGGTKGKADVMFVTADSPRLYVYWCQWELQSLQSQQHTTGETVSDGKSVPPEYEYKLMVSEDNGDNWSNAKDVRQLNNMIASGGKLFGWFTELSNNPDSLFYQSDDMGDTWVHIGTFSPPPLETNEHICTTITANKSGDLILVNAVKDKNKLMTLRTYSSVDFGATWTSISEKMFDISYIISWIGPRLLLINNIGGIRFELSYQYGRYVAGVAFISRDGGLTYEESQGTYGVNGGQFILTDQNDLIMLQNVMVIPYQYKMYFNIAYDLGTVGGTWSPLDELIPETEGSGDGIIRDEDGGLYVHRGNHMIRSFNNGENWTIPSAFLDTFPTGELIVRKDMNSTFYVLIKDDSYDLYFCSSDQ